MHSICTGTSLDYRRLVHEMSLEENGSEGCLKILIIGG